jgi:phosphatidylglycerol---prolipoprotein diacylglyceryl transferase
MLPALASPYYTALIVGLCVAATIAWRTAMRERVDPIAWATLLSAAAAGGLLGSKFLFFDLQPVAVGEKTILGGILGGVLVVLVLARLLGLGAARALDRLTVPTLAGMAIGRIGCFVAECCLGTESELLGHRHPTVLYEAGLDLLLLAAIATRVPVRRVGLRIGLGVTGYAVIRFGTEFLRDRPEFVGTGLNPVQWLMLLAFVGIGAWTLLVARQSAAIAPSASPRLEPTTAAMLVSGLTLAVALGADGWVIAPERFVLILLALAPPAVALRASARLAEAISPRVALVSAPVLGLAFLLQQEVPSAEPRRATYRIGAASWGAHYNRVAGQMPPEFVPAGCGYSCEGEAEQCWSDHYRPGADIVATRRTRVHSLTASVDLPVAAPSRLSLDGAAFVGSDVSSRPDVGEALVGVQTIPVRGIALGLTTGDPNFFFRAGLLGGSLSRNGTERFGATPNLLMRVGGERGFFVEGSAVDEKYHATHGDFSYAGIGYLHARSRTELTYGIGDGQLVHLRIPLGRVMDIDASWRDPNRPKDVPGVAPSWRLGAQYRLQRR